jgi:hypothetical protein
MKHETNSIKVLINTDGSQSVQVVFAGLAAETCWDWSMQLPEGQSATNLPDFSPEALVSAPRRRADSFGWRGVQQGQPQVVDFEVETLSK